jgi:hypothetical protein
MFRTARELDENDPVVDEIVEFGDTRLFDKMSRKFKRTGATLRRATRRGATEGTFWFSDTHTTSSPHRRHVQQPRDATESSIAVVSRRSPISVTVANSDQFLRTRFRITRNSKTACSIRLVEKSVGCCSRRSLKAICASRTSTAASTSALSTIRDTRTPIARCCLNENRASRVKNRKRRRRRMRARTSFWSGAVARVSPDLSDVRPAKRSPPT